MKGKKYIFFGGLPRTGSTLLSSILDQNPDIYAGPNSPVCQLMWDTLQIFQYDERCRDYPKPHIYNLMMSNIIRQYYSDRPETYIIDKCRTWGTKANLTMIKRFITNDIKIIYTIRPILEILSSFMILIRKNKIKINENKECDRIVKQVLIHTYDGIHNLEKDDNRKYVYFINYDEIVKDIAAVIKKIYSFLDIPFFQHDFNNIINKYHSNTEHNPELHKIRPIINKVSPKPEDILSDYIINKYKGIR
jgi:sulfotransferase